MDNELQVTILIIEDNSPQRQRLISIFRKHHYIIQESKNGADALDKLGQILPDLIICNAALPQMDGFELIRQLKTNPYTAQIPTILLTDFYDLTHLTKGLEAGADHYIPKPVDEEYLISKVKTILAPSPFITGYSPNNNPIEVPFPQEKRFVRTTPKTLMNFFLSTYEAVVFKSNQLENTLKKLQHLNENLEHLVDARTSELFLEETNRKQLQSIYEASEQKYAQLVNNSLTGVYLLNFNKIFEFANLALCRMLGYDSLVDISLHLLFSNPSDLEKITRILKSKKQIEAYETCLRTKSGKEINVLLNAAVQNYSIVGFVLDITDRKKAEADLKQSEDLLSQITSSVQDAIIVIDSEQEINFWNVAAERILGYNSNEVMGKNFIQLSIPKKFQQNFLTSISNYKKSKEVRQSNHNWQTYARHCNTTLFPIEYSLSQFDASDSRFTVILLRDISARKETELRLKEARKKAVESDKLKSAFLENLSHEIRTPMNAIMGFSHFLSDPQINESSRNEFIGLIGHSCNNLLEIITDIVDISRIETLQITKKIGKFDLNTLIQNQINMIQKDPKYLNPHIKVSFSPAHSEKCLMIHSDRNILEKIIGNLLKNAVKFTPCGSVEIGYTIQSGPTNQLKFFVKDTGIGIQKNKQDLIFKKFIKLDEGNKNRYGGTGIGLTITKKLVEFLNGQIWVESEPEKGSNFYFTLPQPEPIEMPSQIPFVTTRTTPDFNFKGYKILIAEDIEYNYIYLETILKTTQANLLWAKNGMEAIQLVKENQDLSLVLMDIQMPIINGYQATEKIKAIRPDLPIIAQTAYAMDHQEEEFRQAGFSDVVTKPIKQNTLLDLVNKYLKLIDATV